MTDEAKPAEPAQKAASDSGGGSVLRRRREAAAREVLEKARALDEKRKGLFGGQEQKLLGVTRTRTEQNAVPRDMARVGETILVGYEVFLGLSREIDVAQVFGLSQLLQADGGFELSPVPIASHAPYLADEAFVRDFTSTFRYATGARVTELRRTDERLLVVVRSGRDDADRKVFRWVIDGKGNVKYLDARGEEDLTPPAAHPFAWKQTTRDDQVGGKFPHIAIDDTLFVETIGGDLTVKIENNTTTGLGVYSEPVDDPNQTLDDADIAWAKVGGLYVVKLRPFRETVTRYLVFDPITRSIRRVDALGVACLPLPEDQGLIFPGGLALRGVGAKVLDGVPSDLIPIARVASPNGEDVLFAFFREKDGLYLLLPYNALRKELAPAIVCHGYTLLDDGTLLSFRAGDEPARVHPVQVWQTPFGSADAEADRPLTGSFLEKIGNRDLVRGLADALSVGKAGLVCDTRERLLELVRAVGRAADSHHWLGHAEAGDLLSSLVALRSAAEAAMDEIERDLALAREAEAETAKIEAAIEAGLHDHAPEALRDLDAVTKALVFVRSQRGKLVALGERRGASKERLVAALERLKEHEAGVSKTAASFLAEGEAFAPLLKGFDALEREAQGVTTVLGLAPLREALDRGAEGLVALQELSAGLAEDDAPLRTKIAQGLGHALAAKNRADAVLTGRRRELAMAEGRAELAAELSLFGQNAAAEVAQADSPEACDAAIARLGTTLATIEARFAELVDLLPGVEEKREEAVRALSDKKKRLVEERARRAEALFEAASRLSKVVLEKAKSLPEADALHGFFAADPMVEKLRGQIRALAALGDGVRSAELETRLAEAKEEAFRALRDRADLFEDGQRLIRLGAARFLVHEGKPELVLVPRGDGVSAHVLGTDLYVPVRDEALVRERALFAWEVPSETPTMARAAFLAGSLLLARGILTPVDDSAIDDLVREAAMARLDQGYDRGVHDVDAAAIFRALVGVAKLGGRLLHRPDVRAFACMFFAGLAPEAREPWVVRSRSAGRLTRTYGAYDAEEQLARELSGALREAAASLGFDPSLAEEAATYLVVELGLDELRFVLSGEASALSQALLADLDTRGARRAFEADLRALDARPKDRLEVAESHVRAFLAAREDSEHTRWAKEAAVSLATPRLSRAVSSARTAFAVEGLLSLHPTIEGRALRGYADELLAEVRRHERDDLPRFRAFAAKKGEVLASEEKRLGTKAFAPRVLSTFVRNQLVDEVYLPLIGKNLAKQIGAVGDGARTDRMGLLMLLSPPGYGKTTLLEYVADRLGLVFVKANGPSLSSKTTSLDPAAAPDRTAREEVQKIALALEMGNNVMLCLDDIQHTSPELLQRFVSLCDGQRRIEGVFDGEPRTWDLRGKRFCVVMAGNPYTESGERFRVPDMLANRADTYNLGDVLEGRREVFERSYIENALASHPLLAPLTGRTRGDLDRLLRRAAGEEIAVSAFDHAFGEAEVAELEALLRHMIRVEKTLLMVNEAYVRSASQADAYRTSPPFKLQGSYRNMAKIADKLSPAMTAEEVERVIDDHYASESQTLTQSAEENLLALRELRGRLDEKGKARLEAIRAAFVRRVRQGGAEADPATRVTGGLEGIETELASLGKTLTTLAQPKEAPPAAPATDGALNLAMRELAVLEQLVQNMPPPATAAASDPRIDEISAAIRRVEASFFTLPRGETTDIELGPATESNFYDGMGGVFVDGGVFVATYAKAPAVGARVSLRLAFPDGVVEASGIVAFVREMLAGGGIPGYGVRLAETPELRARVEHFTRLRAPDVV